MTKIRELKKSKPLYDDLPTKLQPFFIDEARAQRKRDYVETDEEVKNIILDTLLTEYTTDLTRTRPLVMKALQNA